MTAEIPAARDVYRAGQFVADDWRPLAEGEEIPADGRVLLPLARFLADADGLAGDNRPLGVIVRPGEGIDALTPYLHRLSVIALVFPKFNDGRAYSYATLLRDRDGYTGELRAVGDVLIDQYHLMLRVGFDAFEVTNAPTRRLLQEGRDPGVRRYYQPAARPEPPAGTRPWLRRDPTRNG